MTAQIEDAPARIFPAVVEELGARFGDAPALIGPHHTLSHAGLAARANRVARWALAQGVGKGDTVCLLMPNRPEYLAIWLGITRIGGIVALLNTNLKGEALAHGIQVAGPGHIIAAQGLADGLSTTAQLWRHGEAFSQLLDSFSGAPLADAEKRDVSLNDPALLIYTSGTTGLPKAAHVSHRRVMSWTHWFAGMTNAGADDRLYNCLPMYHSVGGVVASGAVLLGGGAVILREKFSASAFWRDVADSGATIFQYIGELCRYLLGRTPTCRSTSCAWRWATACRAMSGRRSRPASPFRRSWNSMPPPKAISRSTMPKASPAPSAASRRSWRTAFPPRSCSLMSTDGDPARGRGRLLPARCDAAKRARPSARSPAARRAFEGYTDAAATEKKSCAMCSSPAMPGCAPAI